MRRRLVIGSFVSLMLLVAAAPAGSTTTLGATIRRGVTYAPGLKLNAYLPLPDTPGEPRPAIVFIHGGGFRCGHWSNMDGVGMEAAEHGYVGFSIQYLAVEPRLLCPPYPGHGVPMELQRLRVAVDWVRANAAEYNVDPTRLAVWGASAGGNLAAMQGMLENGPWDANGRAKAAVSWSSVYAFNDLVGIPPGTRAIIADYGAPFEPSLILAQNCHALNCEPWAMAPTLAFLDRTL